jgi:circadian clock protein KaiB
MSGPLSNEGRFVSWSNTKPWVLRLFVARESAGCETAIAQLKRLRAEYLPPGSTIEIIDVHERPEAAEEEQILAIPTLIRKEPAPIRRIIGDLSDLTTVLISIGFDAVQKSALPRKEQNSSPNIARPTDSPG